MAGARVRVLREVETLARVHTRVAIETLVEIMGDAAAPAAARVTAASAVLDRGWGRPQQSITVDEGVEYMSDDDLARSIEQRLAAIAHRAGTPGPAACEDDTGDEAEECEVEPPRLVY